jgi:hypothetical protein
MTAVAVELLTRPLEPMGVPQADPLNGLAPDAVEFVADTDTLLTMCGCSASSEFAKGLPSGHRRVIPQAREAAVAPLVREISPALLWHFDEAGWNVLGYEYAPGRHANYSPESPDLDLLVQLMGALSAIKVPDDPGPLKRAEDRWKPYVDDPASASLFAGPALSHSDWTPDNVLVSPGRAWLIDWA